MKTMNYLLAIALIFTIGSCSKETSVQDVDNEALVAVNFKGSKSQKQETEETQEEKEKTEEGAVYLELDLHRMALEYELHELQLEIVQIEEEIESSDGDDFESLQGFLERFQAELEKVQRMIDDGQIDYYRNEDAISEFRRGPGRGGNPCGGEARCNLILENAKIYIVGRENIEIKMTRNDETCGELVDLVDVPDFDGQLQQAVLESEEGCADEITFSGVNANDIKFTYSLPVAH